MRLGIKQRILAATSIRELESLIREFQGFRGPSKETKDNVRKAIARKRRELN